MPAAGPFPFIAGCLSLCFVDTLGGRGGAPVERIGDRENFARWLLAAGLAPADVLPTQTDIEDAWALREAIYRAARAVMLSGAPAEADIARINDAALAAPPRPQFSASGMRFVADAPVAAAFSAIAADAIATLGKPGRLRECPECRMLCLDTSRPGRRRWCSSAAGCGNRAKVRNHRARKAAMGEMQ